MGSFYKEDRVTEEHDRQFNLFYLSMHRPKKLKGLMSSKNEEDFDYKKITNMAVFDMVNAKTTYLFKNVAKDEVITHFLYELYYRKKDGNMTFNRHSSKILNNSQIDERAPLNKLIVCQKSEETGKKKIWTFDKHGEHKTLITEIDKNTDWRIDVFNQKIITFKRSVEQVEFNDYRY